MNEADDLYPLAARCGERLLAQGLRLAVAESCTGGGLAKVLTDVPGASSWFELGVVSYSNRAKQVLLGVPPEIIEVHGAVSAETVEAMARGALERADAHLAVAISGIAGPAGGSPDKPVGTVWFAWAAVVPERLTVARRRFDGDRAAVRRQAVRTALEGILEMLGDDHVV
ncbi:MAG: hypothetical protein KatS3mg121_0024 [Gammaproteobacteria bacterium]|nr:MAG: hypothetical protein KatS3mg121_0024 [Gammaproteobacteria bacterium]